MFTSALGLTLMGRGLLPWLVIMWRVVWNEVCPLGALSVNSLPSFLG